MENDLYRVIQTDNFHRSGNEPGYDEQFLTYPLPRNYCEVIRKALRDNFSGLTEPEYFAIVNENYELRKFKP